MSKYINENADYFDGFDFENAKPVKHPLIAKAQAQQAQDRLADFFDRDVQQVIKQHNTPKDRERLNAMIRVLFA
ncbi:hypothetical protein B0181_07570 [Moraxella caviae]|uniref:Uncharacterized protein n=1 Tax=Moraxella caviae TaxID=34060 RepID=A0A1S9ZZE7_9GAMM|nr:hypothetical protein [Moraxella caviae]OOR88850.1 hypothetical protein B0181_07570 [Moraxella caviae]STZ10211.1 Uncharacterised protein [Moraxella caviae]VEW12374.1 Uncharacterised protein [Moraxella caviae]